MKGSSLEGDKNYLLNGNNTVAKKQHVTLQVFKPQITVISDNKTA